MPGPKITFLEAFAVWAVLGPSGPKNVKKRQVFIAFLRPLQKRYVFQGGLLGAPGTDFDGKHNDFLTFLPKLLKTTRISIKIGPGGARGRGTTGDGNLVPARGFPSKTASGRGGGGGPRATEF